MTIKDINSIEIEDINDQFINLRAFFDCYGYSSNYFQFALEFNDNYVNVTDEMPFYYNNGVFVKSKKYLDLPFSEYNSYEIYDSRIIKYPGGRGGDGWDILHILVNIFETIEKYGINGEKVIGATTILAIISAVNWTLKFLNNPNCFNNLISFSNKKGITLKTENFLTGIHVNESEKRMIEDGFALIQDLEKEKSVKQYKKTDYN